MEKTARRPSTDPTQERLRQNKANWNKEVSSFINDLIHFKKTMNGWPSKFFKERSRITQPIPADPATIIGSLAGDFQELTQKGNAVIQEQLNYAKNRRQRQPKPAAPAPGQAPAAPATPETPEAPKAPDLTQQIQKGLAASTEDSPLIKLASEFEVKYEMVTEASNPVSRFMTRLFNPKWGFGEAARIRRLRMTMLDACVKSLKELKKLHKEIVKSSKSSIDSSHKIMTMASNHWNIVYRLMSTYKAIRPDAVVTDAGGPLEDEEMKKERAIEEGRDPDAEQGVPDTSAAVAMIKDYKQNAPALGSDPEIARRLQNLNSIVDRIMAAPAGKKAPVVESSGVEQAYQEAIRLVNAEWGTTGSTFQDILSQRKTKTAQRQLGKFRHQVLPGATSGQRLEIYRFIEQIRVDLNAVMDLLEQGFDQEQLTTAITKVHREMSTLRTMVRSLYASEKPDQPLSFF